MKVAYIFNQGGISGAEEQAMQLIPALSDLNNVEVHAVTSIPLYSPKSIYYPPETTSIGTHLWYPSTFEDCLTEIKPDIVIQHCMNVELCRELIRLRNKLGFKLIFRCGSNIFENFLAWGIRKEKEPHAWWLTQGLEHYDAIIAPSEYMKRQLSYVYENVKVFSIPVGILTSLYIPTPYFDGEALKVLFACRLEINNFLLPALLAIRKISRERKISVRILSDGTYRDFWNYVISKYDIDAGLTGWIDFNSKVKALECADVLITPSITHMGVPMSVVEGMASGCLNIVSDLPIYENIKSVIKCDLQDFKSWYDAILSAFDIEKSIKRINMGFEEVKNFDINKIAKMYLEVFKKC